LEKNGLNINGDKKKKAQIRVEEKQKREDNNLDKVNDKENGRNQN
jgi:hypothetical protein